MASFGTDSVLRYDDATGAFVGAFVASGSGGLTEPTGLAYGPDGNLYVVSSGTDAVLRFDGQTGAFVDVFVASGSGGLSTPFGLTFGPDSHLYVANTFIGEVLRFDGSSGSFDGIFVPISANIAFPTGLEFDSSGDLLVANAGNSSVTKFSGTTGAFITTFVAPGIGGLASTHGLTLGPAGELYVSSLSNDRVIQYNGATGTFLSTFVAAGTGGLDVPCGLDFGPDGNLYVASNESNSVFRFNGTTGALIDEFVAPVSGGLSAPTYLAFVPGLPNTAPVADAGADTSANEGTLVALDGSGSSDADDDSLSFDWQQSAGTAVSLDLTDPEQPTFTAPSVAVEGDTLTFRLVVNDGTVDSAPSFVNVNVINVNNAPLAFVGADQTVGEGGIVTLDASDSFDPDGELLTFDWLQILGPAVTLTDADMAQATFTAPLVGPTGAILEFEVAVDDGLGAVFATTMVTITNVNQPPLADAGSNQTVDEQTLVGLDASDSSDPDSDDLDYTWTQIGGTMVTLSDANAVSPTFTAPELLGGIEILTFELEVFDGDLFDCDTVMVTVQDVTAPPLCNLAEARIVKNNGQLSSDTRMWPPNHTLREIRIIGVSDPNSQNVTLTINSVTQDEPLNGEGDGNTDVDAVVEADGTLLLRAERSGEGDGRVYRIHFTATNSDGASCSGMVTVCVPLNPQAECIDSGQAFTSYAE